MINYICVPDKSNCPILDFSLDPFENEEYDSLDNSI
jgi:hypothetical protein